MTKLDYNRGAPQPRFAQALAWLSACIAGGLLGGFMTAAWFFRRMPPIMDGWNVIAGCALIGGMTAAVAASPIFMTGRSPVRTRLLIGAVTGGALAAALTFLVLPLGLRG